MVIHSSPDQWGNDYFFTTMANRLNEEYTNHVNLVVSTGHTNGLMMDGFALVANWTVVGSSGYSGSQVEITPGVHHIHHRTRAQFGVVLYGQQRVESYATNLVGSTQIVMTTSDGVTTKHDTTMGDTTIHTTAVTDKKTTERLTSKQAKTEQATTEKVTRQASTGTTTTEKATTRQATTDKTQTIQASTETTTEEATTEGATTEGATTEEATSKQTQTYQAPTDEATSKQTSTEEATTQQTSSIIQSKEISSDLLFPTLASTLTESQTDEVITQTWLYWSECSRTCGSGTQFRHTTVCHQYTPCKQIYINRNKVTCLSVKT